MAGRHPKASFRFTERSRDLSHVLRRQRTEVLKISRRELAERSQVAESSIQAIEDGRTCEPGLFTVIALAIALQLDLGDMMRSLTGPVPRKPLERAARLDGPGQR